MVPNPHIKTFDLANALALAQLAALAYGCEAQIQYSLERAAHEVRFIACPNTDTQCFVAWDDRAAVVAIRGTSSVRDMLTDLKIRKEDTWMGGVHRGFLAAHDSVEKELRYALAECGSKPLFITGHSLGGALAQLVGALRRWATVITFGQPRVGDSALAYETDERASFYRVVHEEDPVPRLPLWLMGYRHAGTEVFLPSFADAPITFNPPLRYKLLSDVWGIIDGWSRNRVAALADHGIAKYIGRLQQEVV